MANVRANDRETWVAILEAATQMPGDECNDEWRWILQQLRLSPEQYLVLREVLRQGRWRNAKNPKAYIKTAARREDLHARVATAANDPLVLLAVSPEDNEFSVENGLDQISYIRDTSEAVKGKDGIWRRGGGAEQSYEEEYDEDEEWHPVSLRGRLLAKVPNSLKTLVEPSPQDREDIEVFNATTDEWHLDVMPSVHVNLEKWAGLAGFDEWEIRVLRYRIAEISRDEALAEQPDEASRKAVQAAWRRFDRTGKQRLKDFAEKNLHKDVPESALPHTS